MTGCCGRGRTHPPGLTPPSRERGDGSVPPLAIALITCALLFDAYCLVSVARNKKTSLSKWAWALIICVSCPWGGLAYLIFGRTGEIQAPEPPGWTATLGRPDPRGPLPEPPDAHREPPALGHTPAGRGAAA